MANQSAKVFNIDLKSELLTTLNKNDIKQFTGFNQRNCLYANDGLKRFKKNYTSNIYDDKGNYYSLENDQFKINGITVKNVAAGDPFLKKENIDFTYESNSNILWGIPYFSNDTEFKAIQTSEKLLIYIKVANNWILTNEYNGIYKVIPDKKLLVFFNKASSSISVVTIFSGNITEKTFATTEIQKGINFTYKEDVNNIPFLVYRLCESNDTKFNVTVSYEEDTDETTVNYYYFNLEDAQISGTGTIKSTCFFENEKIIDLSLNNFTEDTVRGVPHIGSVTGYRIFAKDIVDIDNDGYCWVSNTAGYITSIYSKGAASFDFDNGNIIPGTYQNKSLQPIIYDIEKKQVVFTSYDSATQKYRFEFKEYLSNFFSNIMGLFLSKDRTITCKLLNNRLIYEFDIDLFIKRAITTYLYTTETGTPVVVYNSNYEYDTEAEALSAGASYYKENVKMLFQNNDSGYNLTTKVHCFCKGDGNIYFSSGNSIDYWNGLVPYNDEFALLYNASECSNISWCGKIFEPFLNIDRSICTPIWIEEKEGFYYKINNNWYFVSEKSNTGYLEVILDRYILLNVKLAAGDIYNLYDTFTSIWFNYASDWNNRFIIGYSSNNQLNQFVEYIIESTAARPIMNYDSLGGVEGRKVKIFNLQMAVGENVNYNEGNIATSIFNPIIFNNILPFTFNDLSSVTENKIITDLLVLDFNNYIQEQEIYISTSIQNEENYVTSNPYYVANYNNVSLYVDQLCAGLAYPVTTDGNIFFNVPLTVHFETSSFAIYYIFSRNVYYQLLTNNDEIILLYGYGTGLSNITKMFVIQGNTYIIRNNIISSCYISDNVIQNVQSVISCKGLLFLGTNASVAFFYSYATKKILGFTGARDFIILSEFSDIDTIYTYVYSIAFKTFFILSNIGCICISDENYVSILEGNFTNIILYTDSIGLYNQSASVWEIFSLYTSGVPVKVKAQTSFYGFGNNQVTIIDTWYVRLYADEAFNGSIKFRVTSLTNKGTESEETEFLITSDMFDKVTNSYYLRYQPKLQRGVGLSLSIESDYDIIELSCSAIADTTVQLSKPFSKQNVINGGKI